MKYLLCFLTLLLTGFTLHAQNQAGGILSGNVTAEDGTAVSFANVMVMQAGDSAFAVGVVAGADGHFSLNTPAKGSYFVRISALGYSSWNSAPFEVSGPGFSRNFGAIVLGADASLLKEVTVQGQRAIIVQHPDKLVVQVDGTALAAGNTAFEVLSRAPGVFVDQDGNIRLNGKGGAQVMLDGKLTYLSGKELRTLLQAMPAENVKELEVIANPSARYDAEGAAGIININLKKNTASGVNGSVYGGYQYNELHGFSGGATINYRKNRLSSFATLDLARRPNLRDNVVSRVLQEPGTHIRFSQSGREEGFRTTPSLRLGTDIELNKRHSIGAMANVVAAQEKNTFLTESLLQFNGAAADLRINSGNNLHSRLANATANLHYTGKLDTAGAIISADLDYVRLLNDTDISFSNRYWQAGGNNPERGEQLLSENPVFYSIYAAKADYTKPLRGGYKLELGAKLSHVESDNELNFFKVQAEGRERDNSRSNHFVYREAIAAAYGNVSGKLSKKWHVQAGLRAEQTYSRGNSRTLAASTSRNYLDLFPSLFLQQHVSDSYSISYQYSRRINRPRYEDLNPFLFFLDPYTLAQGNPYLRPQYTNSWQVVQTLKSSYSLSLGYAATRDYMAEIPEQRTEDTVTVFQKRNVQQFRNLSATLVAPLRVLPRWETSNVLTAAYQHYTTEVNNRQVENRQLFYLLQSSHQVQLPFKIRMEVSAVYQGPMAYGVYQVKPLWWLDMGLKRSFLNEQLDLSLNLTDIFRSLHLKGEFSNQGNFTSFNQYRGSQGVRVQLRYRFSRGEKFNVRRNSSNLEELERANK